MPAGTPWWRRIGRQLVPRHQTRTCCWYHARDWHRITKTGIRLIDQARRDGIADSDIRDHARPGHAVIFHGGVRLGGSVLVNGRSVTLGLSWTERFRDSAWPPFEPDKDVTVHFQVGMDHISLPANNQNMNGLAAIATLISSEVHARVQQVQRLLAETTAEREGQDR